MDRHTIKPTTVRLEPQDKQAIETIKELPAEHRVLEDRAVELRPTKRRRGATRWYDTVTWEIGPSGKELHTPGGIYLLLHRLTRGDRARQLRARQRGRVRARRGGRGALDQRRPGLARCCGRIPAAR